MLTGITKITDHLHPRLVSIAPSLVQITSLSVNRFPNKVAPNVPNNTLRNLPLCYFALILIVSLTPFINKT